MTLSLTITLPFATTAQAQDATAIPKEVNGETVRHSVCLVTCGNRCPLKVIAKMPEWAADITGILATRIRQLAREIASARACYIYQDWGALGPLLNRVAPLYKALAALFGVRRSEATGQRVGDFDELLSASGLYGNADNARAGNNGSGGYRSRGSG